MASVSGVSSSNTSSIYGNRNVFTGLATGMDTESMIENAVSGYQTKISSLQQKQTKLTWKQEAYRAITDPMVLFTRKYTSYTSSTNLLSAGYFNKAVTTTSNGANASKVSATGKTSSDIQILGVKELASAATYRVSGAGLGNSTAFGKAATISGTVALDLDAQVDVSQVSGTLTLQYGGNANKTFDLSFSADEIYADAKAFVSAINEKLADVSYVKSDGSVVKANEVVEAMAAEDGTISFKDKAGSNTVTIQSVTGRMSNTMELTKDTDDKNVSMKAKDAYSKEEEAGMLLAGKSLTVTVDGKSKTVQLAEGGYTDNDSLISDLNTKLGKSFSGVSASLVDGKLQITGEVGSTISVSTTSDVGKALGLGGSTATSYLNTSKTLGDLPGVTDNKLDDLPEEDLKAVGAITKKNDGTYTDSKGNLVNKDGYRIDNEGTVLKGYNLVINGVTVGSYTADEAKNTALETVLTDINANSEVGVNVSFSKTTNSFTFTAEETGASGKIEIKEGGLAAKLFGAVDSKENKTAIEGAKVSAGKDAELTVRINGDDPITLTRSDNSFDIDGLTVTLKGRFGYEGGKLLNTTEEDAVTFTTSADADKIIKDVTSMVEDLNKILKSVHDAYSTQPLKKSNNDRYQPLTEDDEADMTESAIEKYNEKAKTGLLFGDSDLSSLYSKLLASVDTTKLSKLGITMSYSNGQSTLEVDEDALRTALENNPDAVKNAFTDASSGLMTRVKSTLDMYANTSSGSPGILVSKAGSAYASTSLLNNTLQEQLNDLDDEIEKWQNKLSDKVDYYTRMFSQLEQLTAQMNNQSSMLAGLMGG